MARKILKLNKPKAVVKLKKAKTPPPPKIKYKVLKQQSHDLLLLLKTNHPDLFPRNGGSPKPWKVHLCRDVQRRYNVTQRISRIALSFWRKRHHELYIAELIPGAARYDLDGEVAGVVEKVWLDRTVDENVVSTDE